MLKEFDIKKKLSFKRKMKTILSKQNWEISILANLPYKNSGWKNYNSNPDLQALDPMPFQYITKERTSQEEEYMSGTGKMHRSKSVTRGRETI